MTHRKRALGARDGFTLVELLIVIVVIAVLAAIAIPRFVNSGLRSKESALHSDLKLVRNAIALFYADTGAYPYNFDGLSGTVAPSKGLDATGATVTIRAVDWHGPYLASVPTDPVSNQGLVYSSIASGSANTPTVGEVSSSAQGSDSSGTPYKNY